ncbi:hypothetical protein [Pendulispora albinea]|uniref:Uncharacterized protein n=1 Tax=Pendulispora albinea TaxID=2741071 RepID=A0ABZ2M1U8_9BACT
MNWGTVRRNDADRGAVAGYPTSAAYGGGAPIGGRSALSRHVHADAGLRALAMFAKTDRGTEARILGVAWLALDTAFELGP